MDSMFVLDTDIVSLLHEGHPAIQRRLERYRGIAEIVTTIVTRAEILRGRLEYLLKAGDKADFLKAQRLLARSDLQLQSLSVLPLDDASWDLFELYRRTKGIKSIGRADWLIAAITVAHRATLVTGNRKHFSTIPALVLANWVD
jgi:tRNA(fMet)-specific endonuclease VapC